MKNYYLKLKYDDLNDKRIKLLSNEKNGNELVLNYIKLMLDSLESKGIITHVNYVGKKGI